ncbi:hypothetical protein VZT92_014245 [Zoarces viviparus]|uniref:Cryptochrome/DNA photolyase FAD-binding domain-containing protein n=1 Tax=Zoarces viviparus TaxID=48416 RepID=A0AAW1EYI9_ZOAVI
MYEISRMLNFLPCFILLEPAADPRSAFPCSGGESQALARLQHYFWDTDAVATYKETRNGLIGADYSTKFAPWLAMGCLSPRYIYHQIQQYERERTANQSTYWDYFVGGVKYGNRLFQIKEKSVPWNKDMGLFNAWKEGGTGVPFMDANMRELAMTGFMSNRGRQNVASFLTQDLGLDWRMGAELFEYLLEMTPRETRKFNMIKQGLDYDNNGDYVRQVAWGLRREKRRAPSHTSKQHQDRGIDFYFSRSKNL